MAEREHTKSHVSVVVAIACAVCLAAVLGCLLLFNSVSAHAGSESTTFGIGDAQVSTTSSVAVLARPVQQKCEEASISESISLTYGTTRSISHGVQSIIEKKEAERRAAEEAARIAEQERIAAAEAAKAQSAAEGLSALSDVDWSIGKTAFIEEWAERIDAYLSGSPLAGQGVTFAAAAWENGVDPRWSPAISNTESSKGSNCFLPYNAWGWGSSSFSCWEDAINAHVAGLASGYGYTISVWAAQKYCPPNYSNWFSNTLSEMSRI
ncbi:MAG: CMP-2-keto-3-deoxyoctulosonic acid synthetase [Eggerthellaceae bacterium]|nr:CMP-2-keto-3-deoxyoctulosonic acid synthetase [Eggerthellaceae bacterium]